MTSLANSIVFCSCQEILVPFTQDERMPEDCLYWILEEDFRFWPPGRDPDQADQDHVDFLQRDDESGGPGAGRGGWRLEPAADR